METATPIPNLTPSRIRVPAIETFHARAATLHATGDPVRLQILWHLSLGEQNVIGLTTITGKRQQAVSHHLTILKLRQLVAMHRRGKSNFYSLTDAGRAAIWCAPFA